ncbi:hypothetical protein H5410_014836 [Solanum commersonii]|uniref:Uncharacterized protein n=1 Tax=Solanum commersonii TaxID=4109 RepID=A0A9J5ZSL9_SOLCO|nr:hypothetical protein H5410_014836 [Solanum commersonii]
MRIFGNVHETLKEVDQKARKGVVGELPISSASSTVPPSDLECEDAKGKTLEILTNVAEQSSAAQSVKTINTS